MGFDFLELIGIITIILILYKAYQAFLFKVPFKKRGSDEEYDDEYDLMVIGLGGAGVVAAIDGAQRFGKKVLVIERFVGGGATKLSGGVVYAGGGTRLQKEAGFEDTEENFYSYLVSELNDKNVPEEILRKFCSESKNNFEWLESLGVPFGGGYYPKKTSYPPNDYSLYYSGNELSPPMNENAIPCPRGHRPLAKGQAGRILYDSLLAVAKNTVGLDIRTQTKPVRLLVNENDEVIGAEISTLSSEHLIVQIVHTLLYKCFNYQGLSYNRLIEALRNRLLNMLEDSFGVRSLVHTKCGIILSTGGFVFNRDMVRKYAPEYLRCSPLGTPGDNGSGIKLGQSVGGKVSKMDQFTCWKFISPPIPMVEGLLVNLEGKRICDESKYGASLGRVTMDNKGKSFLIVDDNIRERAISASFKKETQFFQAFFCLMYLYFNRWKARSLKELCGKTGIDLENLKETIEEYNEDARKKKDSHFGKSSEYLHTLEPSPYFYAVDLSVDSKTMPTPVLSLGGLSVDQDSGQVLRESNDKPIIGLYAAGRTAAGILSNGYNSGFCVADCVFSARRAVGHAFTNKKQC